MWIDGIQLGIGIGTGLLLVIGVLTVIYLAAGLVIEWYHSTHA